MDLTTYIQHRQEIRTFAAKSIKATGEMRLEVLGAPFGGPIDGKDRQGEYFSERTDFMMNIGDKRPVIYFHGMTPRGANSIKPETIGTAELVKKDSKGLWFDVVLNEGSELARRVWEAARDGLAKASSGAIDYLIRVAKKTGEILTWPLGELSLLDENSFRKPVNDLAVVNLKALFDNAGIEYPESFSKSGELEETAVQEDGDTKIYIIHKK